MTSEHADQTRHVSVAHAMKTSIGRMLCVVMSVMLRGERPTILGVERTRRQLVCGRARIVPRTARATYSLVRTRDLSGRRERGLGKQLWKETGCGEPPAVPTAVQTPHHGRVGLAGQCRTLGVPAPPRGQVAVSYVYLLCEYVWHVPSPVQLRVPVPKRLAVSDNDPGCHHEKALWLWRRFER